MDCTSALAIDGGYMKAYMRRASAYEQSDDLERALADYKKVGLKCYITSVLPSVIESLLWGMRVPLRGSDAEITWDALWPEPSVRNVAGHSKQPAKPVKELRRAHILVLCGCCATAAAAAVAMQH